MKKKVYITHSAHLDLFWMGTMENCMADGARIIDAAITDMTAHSDKYFVVESVRFLEYYLTQKPEKVETVKKLIKTGQLEVGACYSDRLENHHDGESLVRNVIYGKKLLKKLTGHETKIAVHHDLPGLTEQTPQILKKAQVEYYLFARGYYNGGRFNWKGLDGSYITAYNYPIHYTYYNFQKLMEHIPDVEKALQSDKVLISCSAGDLGVYGTFILQGDSGEQHVDLAGMMAEYNQGNHPYEVVLGNVYETLESMPKTTLPVNFGESPSRWGTYGSATNVSSFQEDKQLSVCLSDAEKLLALCRINGIDCSKLKISHPFKKTCSSHDIRCYFDKKEEPQTLNDWIDFAWRLQLVTQDHNYGGIGGIASDFDRHIYKKCAGEIADEIIRFSIQRLADQAGEPGELVIINTLNWSRSEKIILEQKLDEEGSYAAVDKEGNYFPIVTDDGVSYFESPVPALGYKCVRLTKTSKRTTPSNITESNTDILIDNNNYRVTFDKKQGAVSGIWDKSMGKELVGDTLIGIIDAYEDCSVDVHEELYEKKLIASTTDGKKEITSGENELFTWILMTTELCNARVELKIKVYKFKKEISISPVIYWIGTKAVQLRMHLGVSPTYKTLYYGVPYGIQKFGNYMDGAYPSNPNDEISDALFDEYREIQGWFAVEQKTAGISVSTNQSSFAFKKDNRIEAILIRTVQSCGDFDVTVPNHGRQEFHFHLTSYEGQSVRDNDTYFKQSWSYRHPLYTTSSAGMPKSSDSSSDQFLKVNETGLLSALSVEGNIGTARFFSVSTIPGNLHIEREGKELPLKAVDLLGNPINEDQTLRCGDIKTVCFPI